MSSFNYEKYNSDPNNPTPIFVSKKKARWMKLNQRYAQEFEKQDWHELADKLKSCETTRTLCCCANCGKHWYVLTHCRHRICVLCSFKIAQERQKFLMYMTKGMQHPKLITLTMEAWTGEPRAGIKKLRDALTKLRRTQVWAMVKGGAYTIELIPKDDFWHIHVHLLVDAPFIPHQKLFSEWRECIQQHVPQVDIRSASSEKARKYIVKDASKNIVFYCDPEKIVDWFFATQNVRLFATFGTWYHAKIQEQLELEAFEEFEPACPFCGATHAVFYARDGPWTIGPEMWRDAFVPLLDKLPDQIPAEVVILDEPKPAQAA